MLSYVIVFAYMVMFYELLLGTWLSWWFGDLPRAVRVLHFMFVWALAYWWLAVMMERRRVRRYAQHCWRLVFEKRCLRCEYPLPPARDPASEAQQPGDAINASPAPRARRTRDLRVVCPECGLRQRPE